MREKLRNKEPHIEKKVDQDEAFYTIFWSPLKKSNKYDIICSVPKQAGLLELYYMDEHHRLFPMYIQRVWYGGLRARLRRITDPELVVEKPHRDVLESYDTYYRYTLTESLEDMNDLIYFFSLSYLPSREPPPDSGRYDRIFVEEVAPDKINDLESAMPNKYEIQ